MADLTLESELSVGFWSSGVSRLQPLLCVALACTDAAQVGLSAVHWLGALILLPSCRVIPIPTSQPHDRCIMHAPHMVTHELTTGILAIPRFKCTGAYAAAICTENLLLTVACVFAGMAKSIHHCLISHSSQGLQCSHPLHIFITLICIVRGLRNCEHGSFEQCSFLCSSSGTVPIFFNQTRC
jgi:hypothetical protein